MTISYVGAPLLPSVSPEKQLRTAVPPATLETPRKRAECSPAPIQLFKIISPGKHEHTRVTRTWPVEVPQMGRLAIYLQGACKICSTIDDLGKSSLIVARIHGPGMVA